jgi:hypothetical protein
MIKSAMACKLKATKRPADQLAAPEEEAAVPMVLTDELPLEEADTHVAILLAPAPSMKQVVG